MLHWIVIDDRLNNDRIKKEGMRITGNGFTTEHQNCLQKEKNGRMKTDFTDPFGTNSERQITLLS